jgi:AAA domain
MPGTGKTTTIIRIIKSLLAKSKSVLLTSYTHTAVDNVLLKLKAAGVDVLRFGNREKVGESPKQLSDCLPTTFVCLTVWVFYGLGSSRDPRVPYTSRVS